MVHRIPDRWKQYATSAGTADFTMDASAALGGFVALAAALPANGDTAWYCAVNPGAGEFEIALGTRTGATALARPATPLSSSNAGAKVNFSAPPLVFSTVPGAKLSATGGPAFRAYRSTVQTGLTNSTYVKINFNAEEFDTDACFDSTTNFRFTPNVAGYYRVEWCISLTGTTLTDGAAKLYKNGSPAGASSWGSPRASVAVAVGAATIFMNGTTDYLEVFGYSAASSGNSAQAGIDATNFSGCLVRPA